MAVKDPSDTNISVFSPRARLVRDESDFHWGILKGAWLCSLTGPEDVAPLAAESCFVCFLASEPGQKQES